MYDLIGDIHGHADHLKALLTKLGYTLCGDTWSHPERKVLFLGDYIDRGPRIRETLHIVRHMVEAGQAVALMGNHEYNAICFYHPERKGGHLRPHSIKNILQHYETLKAFERDQEAYDEWLKWLETLPIFFENGDFRAVHACWDARRIAFLENRLISRRLNEELLYASADSEDPLYDAIEITLKGPEMTLPACRNYTDGQGIERDAVRVKWWIDPEGKSIHEYGIHLPDDFPDQLLEPAPDPGPREYPDGEKPVFFGHYQFASNPSLCRHNVCCLDFSQHYQSKITAYRHDGEARLSNDRFVWV